MSNCRSDIEKPSRSEKKVSSRTRVAAKIASASTVAAVERLARADRRHAATSEEWDRDPWALNTLGGVVDLRTGRRRDHDRADRMTRMAGAAPEGDCPIWKGFLATVTNNDAELQAYLKRMVASNCCSANCACPASS